MSIINKRTIARTFFLLSILIFGYSISIYSQQNNLQFESIQEGLSQSNVTCIIQDKFGFMWFGTRNGLNQYDGYGFKIYEHEDKDFNSISNNWIGSLLEDSKGNLWIGTYGGGLNLFDRATEQFTKYRFDKNDSTSLSSDNVASVFEDSKGVLWVATAKGLNRYIPESNSFIRYITNSSSLHSDNFSVVFEDSEKNLWLGTHNNGLIIFDVKNNRPIEVFKANISDTNSISGNKIKTALKDQKGDIWIGTADKGLNKIEVSSSGKITFKKFLHDNNNLSSLSHNSVISLCEDSNGNIWVGTENGGLNWMDVATETFKYFKHDPTNVNSLTSNSIWSIYENDAGILWMGTFNKGIIKLDKKRFKFRHYKQNTVNKNSLNQNAVNAFIEDDNGNIWVGTDGGGLNYFNPKTSGFLHITHQPNNLLSLGSNAVLDLYRDSKNRLWVSTWAGGVNVMQDINKPENKFKHFRKGEHFFNIIEDKDHTFWLASWEEGLIHIDENFKVLDTFTPLNQDPLYQLSSTNVFALLLDHKKRLWVNTLNGLNLGTKQVNGKYKFEKFYYEENDTSSISSNISYFVYQDSKNNIWIGTNMGLCLFEESTKSFKRYTKNDGLPDVDIKSMMEDNEGHFWLGTTRGLSKVIDFKSKDIINYKRGDGLQGTEFNRGAIFKTSKGKILAGGNNGFNYFSLDQIKENAYQPKVYLSNFKIFNKEVPIKTSQSPLKQSLLLTKEVTLSHKESVFSFDFVGLNYTHPERNQYAYRLEGLEEKWNYVNTQRSASYSNLNPGKYTFWVKASNNDGVWNDSALNLSLIITPPWWDIWWVKALFILIFIGIILAIYFTRVNILKAQKEKLEEKVKERTNEIITANAILQEQQEELKQFAEETRMINEKLETSHQELEASMAELHLTKIKAEEANQSKTQFLANMSHEIRSPLNAIVGFGQIIMTQSEKMKISIKFRENLGHIISAGQNLSELINNILDLSKIESGKMELLIEAINLKQLFQGIYHINKNNAQKKSLNYNYNFSSKLPEFIKSDRTKLNQILMNLISNAIKFTSKNKSIEIEAGVLDGHILFKVKDEGIGIDKQRIDKVFKPFEQANNTITRSFGGTGLGLTITKQMVDMLNGEIWVESERGVGSTFYVKLPLIVVENEGEIKEELSISDYNFSPENVILCVEDIELNQQLIAALFEELNLKIHFASGGREGIKKVKELNPDLVLMDIHMPGMDGKRATKNIRRLPEYKKLPIVALSADAFIEQQKQAIEAGVNEYVTKPLDFKKLLPILSKYLKQEKEGIIIKKENKDLPKSKKLLFINGLKELKNIKKLDFEITDKKILELKEVCSGYNNSKYYKILNDLEDLLFLGEIDPMNGIIEEVLTEENES